MKARHSPSVVAAIAAAALTTSPAVAEQPGLHPGTDSNSPVTYRHTPAGISFRSQELPAWTLLVQQQTSALASRPDAIRSVQISAIRTLPAQFPHHLFASIKVSPSDASDYPDWVLIPPEAGRAATVGWRIGNLHRLNMAVEVEHRELGQDKQITSLSLDVHYYF